MIAGPMILVGFWVTRPLLVSGFSVGQYSAARRHTSRLFASSSTSPFSIENHISRLGTLRRLLSRRGAPGSKGCYYKNDLESVVLSQKQDETPELIASLDHSILMGDEIGNLHPYLYPIARSKSSGNYICAYLNPHLAKADSKNDRQPWPIVETSVGAPGMNLLALSSEHLMRRIVCECDFEGTDFDLVESYNDDLDLVESGLNTPYTPGDVAKLGYGVDKYVLLRVGPFPDLYQSMAQQHAGKGDERSSLIAAETASSKLPGFASTFLFYARLLQSFAQRDEEARDAARMCLRLPLTTIGMSHEDIKDVAVLGQMADANEGDDVAFEKLISFYKKMKEVERDDGSQQQGKTAEQKAIDDVNELMDIAALQGVQWSSIRPTVSAKLRDAGIDEIAAFVDLSS